MDFFGSRIFWFFGDGEIQLWAKNAPDASSAAGNISRDHRTL
jgi:hypothetical protein